MKVKRWPSSGFFLCPLAAIVVATIGTSPAVAEPETQAASSIPVAQARFIPAARDLAAIEERRAITLELEKLMDSGATPEQMAGWHARNAARLATSQQKLAEMSASQNSVPKPYITEVPTPAGASKTMEAFQMARAKLYNEQVRIHNQTLQESPENRNEASEVWQKQNAVEMEAQASRASQIIAEGRSAALPSQSSLTIPADASPALRKFLIQRTALVREEAEVTAGLQTASPEQRQKTLEAWHDANPTRLSDMREAVEQLSIESKTSR